MCGISGIIDQKPVTRNLLTSIANLEYRGYDSCGMAMLNGVVLVSFINELRDRGLTLTDAVRKGCELRLRPVLMTALTTILAITPLLLSSGVGAETQRPLASVVIGGLFTSTLLTLVLLPVIYEWIETRSEPRGSQ